jgi:hypothetical protein
MKQYYSEGIEIPDRVSTAHQLAYFLLREYMEEEHYKYTRQGKFDVLFENSNAYGIGLFQACKATAIEVIKRYTPELNSRYKQQFVFIVTKHLEATLAQAKEN